MAKCPVFNSRWLLAIGLIGAPMTPTVAVHGQAEKISLLRIASTGTITGKADSATEKAGHETLRKFVKDETGLANEILGQENWQDLVSKLAKGDYHLGVFQGHEFAWAQEKFPELKPLAVGINVYRYPIAAVMVQRNSPAKEFADLKGKILTLPPTGQAYFKLYVDRQCENNGAKAAEFFSQITAADSIEDAFDNLIEGKAQATVVDQATLDAFKRRQPGRFNQLKEIARSQPFPPIVVAYYGNVLDAATLQKFKEALLSAAKKQKGEMLLTLSHLTAFEAVPADFDKILAETRKAFPKEMAVTKASRTP